MCGMCVARANAGSCTCSCYVIVQSSVDELRSIHLVIAELSPADVVEAGPTAEGSSTWCYRLFSHAMSVIEGMTVATPHGLLPAPWLQGGADARARWAGES